MIRYYEVVVETEPTKPIKPLTPAQSRRRAERQANAHAKLADTEATAAIKINAAKRRLTEI